jgi:miniconductance mechanosensitive channel
MTGFLATFPGRLAVAAALSAASYAIGAALLQAVLRRALRRAASAWDGVLSGAKAYSRLAGVLPPLAAYSFLRASYPHAEGLPELGARFAAIWVIVALAGVAMAALETANGAYAIAAPDAARRKPIKGYIQLLKIFVALVAAILAYSSLFGVSPVGVLGGLGAMSAVVLIIFKDSILGLVASYQLTSNDLVRLGDWIDMPKYGADGNVVDITMQSIIVQNWDMTTTSIPVYALISDSFKNWRGMSESGGRRIRRVICLDVKTVRLLSVGEIERLARRELLPTTVTAGYLTNLGAFRTYAETYLDGNPRINAERTHMVRYLETTPKGIPMELYLFNRDKTWIGCENLSADILDHLLSVTGEFGLRAFQDPSGWDIIAYLDHPDH